MQLQSKNQVPKRTNKNHKSNHRCQPIKINFHSLLKHNSRHNIINQSKSKWELISTLLTNKFPLIKASNSMVSNSNSSKCLHKCLDFHKWCILKWFLQWEECPIWQPCLLICHLTLRCNQWACKEWISSNWVLSSSSWCSKCIWISCNKCTSKLSSGTTSRTSECKF